MRVSRRTERSACGTLAISLANMIALLNPERVVIGGGVALMGEPFIRILREELAQRVFGPYRDRYALVPARLGEEGVVWGTGLRGPGAPGEGATLRSMPRPAEAGFRSQPPTVEAAKPVALRLPLRLPW